MHKHLIAAGNTPTVFLERWNGSNLYLKLEGYNPSGALKDRLVNHVLSTENSEGKTVLDASSGSHGCALAYWGAVNHVPVHIVSNAKISAENKAAILGMGAIFTDHGTVTKESRDFCQELVEKDPDQYFFFDQLGRNGAHPAYHGIASEILCDVPETTAIVASKGSGVTLLGICEQLTGTNVEVFGTVGIAGDKSIVGTYKPGADFETESIRVLTNTPLYRGEQAVSFETVMAEWQKLLRRGVLVGPQGAGVLLAMREIVDNGTVSGSIVGVAGDTALKHFSRLQV